MMMWINPEFRKNLWLEFSTQKIFFTPIAIGLWLWICESARTYSEVGKFIMYFFIFFWGIKRASESVINELNANTWDFQRLSSLSPTSLTIGKLFGSTSFTWFGGLIAFFSLLFYPPSISQGYFSLSHGLLIILGGLFGQALALNLSLNYLPSSPKTSVNSFRFYLIALAISLGYTFFIIEGSKFSPYQTISWHSFEFTLNRFQVVSFLIFFLWTLWGSTRQMAINLQYRLTPWVWALFTVYCMVYFSGFSVELPESYDYQSIDGPDFLKNLAVFLQMFPALFAWAISGSLCYIALFSQQQKVLNYKKLWNTLKNNRLNEHRFWWPRWLISFSIFVCMTVWLIAFKTELLELDFNDFSSRLLITNCFFLVSRDCLLLVYMHFSYPAQKANFAGIFYFFLLYFLVPAILPLLGLTKGIWFFIPTGLVPFGWIALLGILLQNMGILYLIIQKFSAYPRSSSSSK